MIPQRRVLKDLESPSFLFHMQLEIFPGLEGHLFIPLSQRGSSGWDATEARWLEGGQTGAFSCISPSLFPSSRPQGTNLLEVVTSAKIHLGSLFHMLGNIASELHSYNNQYLLGHCCLLDYDKQDTCIIPLTALSLLPLIPLGHTPGNQTQRD